MGHLIRGFLILPLLTWAQESDSLQSVQLLKEEVRALCRFQGRGYIKTGYAKAAHYLRKRFLSLGYAVRIDTFRHAVRYVRKAHIRVPGGPIWQLGIDFWPEPASPSARGTWSVDSLPRSGRLWLVLDTLSLKEIAATALRHRVAGVLMPQSKVNASYAQAAWPLLLIYTTQRPPVGTLLRVEITITSQEVENYNILAEKRGRSADSLWILGAHYDHLGRVGRTIFWGANDNASGVAFLLLLAKRLKAKTLPYNILFVAFGAEEVGLIGAYDFVNRYKTRLPMTKGMLNFDLMGFGEKGLGVVGAADQPVFWAQVKAHQPTSLQGVPLLLRPNAPNSDHYPFRQQGCPAFFFYLMGGPGYYHDPMDRPETLSWMGAYELSRWVEAVIRGK